MLVLSRKKGERVFIGDTICVTVLDVQKGRVRLGLTAPMEVPIHREELLERGFSNPLRDAPLLLIGPPAELVS